MLSPAWHGPTAQPKRITNKNMTYHYKHIFCSLWLLFHRLLSAALVPIKWIQRKFTLWRLEPARLALNRAFEQSRITSVQLHHLDAQILRRGGFHYLWMLLFCVALLTGPNVRAQLTNINYPNYQSGQPNFFYNDTNYSAFVVSNGYSQSFTAGSTNTYIKTIRQNQGLSLFLAVWSTNGGLASNLSATNYTLKFDVTGDGSTWTRGSGAQPLTWSVNIPGPWPGTNVFWTNLPITTMSNVRKIQVTGVSTTASNVLSAALGYSQSTQ